MGETQNSSLSEKAEAAMRQAAVKVVERARQTSTPLIVWEEGRVKEVPADQFQQWVLRSDAHHPSS